MHTMPTRRQALILSLGAATVLTLTSCNRGEGGAKTVMFAVSTQTNPFFVQLVEGAKEKAKAIGLDLQVQDASNDSARQANQLQNAISQSVPCVILNPTDSDAVSASVTALNNAKIPVIAVDRSVSNGTIASFISSDNVAGGAQAAQALAEALGGSGQVIILQGTPGTSAAREREKGFTQEISKYTGISVVASQPANFDRAQALDVTTNLLQANPQVTGIFAANDEMALGAIEALGARAGEKVKVVGFDGTVAGLKAVKAGTMYATIAQQPKKLGKTAVEQAAKVLAGESPEAQIQIPVVTITKNNVQEAL